MMFWKLTAIANTIAKQMANKEAGGIRRIDVLERNLLDIK